MLFISTPNPEGKTLLMDMETASVHRTYKSEPCLSYASAAYSPLTNALFLSQEKSCLYQFSPTMQQPIHRSFASEKVTALAASPCGTLVIGGGGETGVMFVWNVLTGELLRLVKGHLRKVWCLSFSNDGSQFASASDDSTCKVWTLGHLLSHTQSNPAADIVFTAHTVGVTACAFLNTFRAVATASADRNIKVFHAASGTQLLSVTVDLPLTTIAVSKDDSTIVAGGQQGALFFLSLRRNDDDADRLVESGQQQDRSDSESHAPLNDASTSSSIIGFPITNDDTWTPLLRKRPAVEGGHAKSITSIDFLPYPKSHQVVVSSENGAVLVWDTKYIRVIQELPRFKKGICSAVLVSSFRQESIPVMTYDLCMPLSKYPVDPHGQVGYVVPTNPHFAIGLKSAASSSAAPTTNSLSSITTSSGIIVDADGVPLSLPNVKYNKGKQKRLREELSRITAETEQRRKIDEQRQKQFQEEISQHNSAAVKFEETAKKLQEKIDALEARAGAKKSKKVE